MVAAAKDKERAMSGIAQIHHATLKPTKLELLTQWLPKQPWFTGDGDDLERVASFRFVDPDGEVGIETILVSSAGTVFQVPLTYRDAALVDADGALVGTMDHSVLGQRWVYDGVDDPVYVAELFRVIHEGDNEAELSTGEKSMTVEGSGITRISNAAGEMVRLIRVVDESYVPTQEQALGTLTGAWTDADGLAHQAVLVVLR